MNLNWSWYKGSKLSCQCRGWKSSKIANGLSCVRSADHLYKKKSTGPHNRNYCDLWCFSVHSAIVTNISVPPCAKSHFNPWLFFLFRCRGKEKQKMFVFPWTATFYHYIIKRTRASVSLARKKAGRNVFQRAAFYYFGYISELFHFYLNKEV